MDTATGTEPATPAAVSPRLRDREGVASAVTLAALVVLCVVGPWLRPYSADFTDWENLSVPPGIAHGHWLGTDAIGRDVFVRLCIGGRVSLLIGGVASALALVLGLGYGAVAGYFGGWVDRVLMRLLDVAAALPFLLIVILLLTVFERSLVLLLAAIGGYVWMDLARVVRAEAARLRQLAFVDAARLVGAPARWILLRHIVPNVLGLALVYLSLGVPNAILIESFLGFLGLSVDEPGASWGAMLFDGSQEMDTAPWCLMAPAVALVTTLLACQMLGEALRRRLDPRSGLR
ncbi:ABC transporter permease [Tahibacter amnicola]|uniref:Oligopeptide transport system permease protein OppC n=1 Tax=Tahibacter amnicola TaxID=2976241 RepID=A0ABY6BL06_9GAMM|nr:ABC transporter permease [Tahibacter amnicola]UXI68487.1 ABC transporter permease [Tahibacter amnicola]